MQKQKILIIGGGFAGVKLARIIGRDKGFAVTLMSDEDSLYYYPALYRSVTGYSLKESEIPLQTIFESFRGSVKLVKDRAEALDGSNHTVTGKSGKIYKYDKVIFAVGAVTSYFGIAGIEKFALEMKSPQKARELRHHLHSVLTEGKDSERDFVVIGGGPTGVELSAGLVGYLREIAKKHNLKRHAIRVHLVEASPSVVPRLKRHSIKLVSKRLRNLGVRIMCNTRVESENAEGLVVKGKELKSKVVIWTAGVANNPFFSAPANKDQFNFNKRGRVVVNGNMSAADDVFVIGDNAAMPYAGLAQTAVNDAKYMAKYLRKSLHGRNTRGYLQPQPTTAIPVGPHWAIVEWGKLIFGGWPGGVMRSLADLIGYVDVLPLGKALKIWLRSSEREDECKFCHGKNEI